MASLTARPSARLPVRGVAENSSTLAQPEIAANCRIQWVPAVAP